MSMLPADLLATFDALFAEAVAAGEPDPTAMALATADAGGSPSVRMVLLKAHGPDGFVFYTHVDGRKGRELAANPRASNVMGQIIRWREEGDFDGLAMRWDHLVLAGDPANARAEAQGNVKGDIFACPDGLMLDARGVLWIQTDAHASQMNQGEFARIGNNQMLACDRTTGEVRRFLTGPVNCEITGATLTPDGRTMFINVQHPGETSSDRSDPDEPNRFSRWPFGGRPRSATVAIRRRDGGPIGT